MADRRHRETPTRRVTNGKTVWVARYTRPDGKRAIWKPGWNGGRGTFDLRRDAQAAIDEAYDHHDRHGLNPETVGAYAATWTARHPRAERTNDTNDHRIGRVLDVKVDGVPLRDWTFRDLKRRHALELVDHMLREHGRARTGVVNILRSLSAMAEDAITDEVADVNFAKGVKVRSNDPRIRKQPKEIRIFSFDEMREFAAAARELRSTDNAPVRNYEALVRAFSDLGLRLGEVLPLERADLVQHDGGHVMLVRQTAHEGEVERGTKRDRLRQVDGELGRPVPVPPSFLEALSRHPVRIDTRLLFPTPAGLLFRERNFYRDVWHPLVRKTGMDCTPHEFRHSYVSHLRAAGVDDADLAAIAGHTVETMISRYTHPLAKSHDRVRELLG